MYLHITVHTAMHTAVHIAVHIALNSNLNFILQIFQNENYLNPIRSGGEFKPSPPQFFFPHAFNFGATLLCIGDFSPKKIV